MADSIRVDTNVKVADQGAAATVSGKITTDSINRELANVGLPAAIVLEVSAKFSDGSDGAGSTRGNLLTGLIGGAGGAVVVAAAYWLQRRRRRRMALSASVVPTTLGELVHGGATDEATDALLLRLWTAAENLGLVVQVEAGDGEEGEDGRFDTPKLVMGIPPDAGRGINPFLHYADGEEALLTQAGRGLAAIYEEIETYGTDEERECRDYVLRGEAGSDSVLHIQNYKKRDCDPGTGRVLASRQMNDAAAPGGRRGMRFADFMAHRVARYCELSEAEVFALRYYTTAGFKGINQPLRDQDRRAQRQAHNLAVLVFILTGAIKKLRAWAARAADARTPVDLFRGMSNREIFDTFMEEGGTELAPMSTTAELEIALNYCQGPAGSISTLLWIRTDNFMDRGVDLEWLSAFPYEKEYLYPPLSYLRPIREAREGPIVRRIGDCIYQVVELKVHIA